MSLYAMFKGRGPSGFGYGSTAEEVTAGLDLSGKTYLVTGCNSGLGSETMRVLKLRGARVLGAARSQAKADAACGALTQGPGSAEGVPCELSEPASVRACVEAVKAKTDSLDGIICNAGIMALPERQQAHGVELQLMTNHVGHFILVTGLLDLLSDTARVVMVSSTAHHMAPPAGINLDDFAAEKSYDGWKHYGQSKLANLLFARHLAKRFEGTGKTANAVHPGVIQTNLGRHMNIVMRLGMSVVGPLGFKSIPQGASTQLYVATHPSVKQNGAYFFDCNEQKSSRHGRDENLAEGLWKKTEELVANL